ncbi:MAG: D-arabinono-1,4-lactone oxidase [Alphaproteobacteria bacterium]
MTKATIEGWQNWSGGQSAAPARIFKPQSAAELAAALPDLPTPIRPVGSGHSFTPLVPTDGTIIDIAALNGIVRVDGTQATLRAGSQLRTIGAAMRERDLAFKNQGDIDHQTIGGALGTGTHGTGLSHGSFSDTLIGCSFLLADGTKWQPSNEDELNAARVSVGTLGLMTEATLDLTPAYDLAEESQALPLDEALAAVHGNQYRHAEFFAFPHADNVILKTLDIATNAHDDWPDAEPLPQIDEETTEDVMFKSAATTLRFFPNLAPALHQSLMAGIGVDRRKGPSNLIFPSPRNARFNEMEYAVPLSQGPNAIRAVIAAMREEGPACMWPVEYRTLPASTAWLSPAFERDSVTISIHQYGPVNPKPLFGLIEPLLRKFEGRPHWGKMHSCSAPDLRALYPRFDDFGTLRQKLDPEDRLLNPALANWLAV